MSFLRRSRYSGAVAPATSLNISPTKSLELDNITDDDTSSPLQPFISAPTTPRARQKRCHFADTPPERIGPQRTNTAPPRFDTPSTSFFQPDDERSWLLEKEMTPDDEDFPVLLEDPEDPLCEQIDEEDDKISISQTEPDHEELNPLHDLEVATGNNDISTPPEELPRVSADDDLNTSKPGFLSKQGKSHSITGAWPLAPDRIASLDYHRSPSASTLYSKPAFSPVIKTHAAASPARSSVHSSTGSSNISEREDGLQVDDDQPVSPCRSPDPSSSFLSATWDQKADSACDMSEATRNPSGLKSGHRKHRSSSGDDFDMLKAHLSALSRADGYNDAKSAKKRKMTRSADGTVERLPSDSTRSGWDQVRQGNGRHTPSGVRGSSPIPTARSEWPQTYTPPTNNHTCPPLKSNLKQAVNSKIKARFLPAHRDSLEIARHRLADKWPMMDPSLSSSRDSLVLTKQRFDKYPKSQVIVDEQTGQVKFGGLSPIMDASPPDIRAHWAARSQQVRQDKARRWYREIGGHPAKDMDCPICEVERPRSRRLSG